MTVIFSQDVEVFHYHLFSFVAIEETDVIFIYFLMADSKIFPGSLCSTVPLLISKHEFFFSFKRYNVFNLSFSRYNAISFYFCFLRYNVLLTLLKGSEFPY